MTSGEALAISSLAILALLLRFIPRDAERMPGDFFRTLLEHLEQSGFEIDGAGEALRRKPQAPLHQTPGE